jgi:hypothetical protein
MKIRNKIIALMISLIAMPTLLVSAEKQPYFYGGVKLFNYGLENGDLRTLNVSIVNLGFSSSTSSTDNRGYGVELGLGYDFNKNLAVEAGYTNFGTLTINNRTTGPTTSNTLDITGYSLGVGVLGKFGEEKSYGYIKAGLHNWDMSGKLSTSLGSSSEALGTGTDPMFSVGYRADIFQISYDGYQIDDRWFKSFTIGLKYNF